MVVGFGVVVTTGVVVTFIVVVICRVLVTIGGAAVVVADDVGGTVDGRSGVTVSAFVVTDSVVFCSSGIMDGSSGVDTLLVVGTELVVVDGGSDDVGTCVVGVVGLMVVVVMSTHG